VLADVSAPFARVTPRREFVRGAEGAARRSRAGETRSRNP